MTTYHDQARDADDAGSTDRASWQDRRPPTPPGYGADFEPRRLYRSTSDRVWAGVCGGLAEHFGWDPSVTRVGYAILTIFTGIFPMLILYVVMAMVIPNGPLPGSQPIAGQPGGGEPNGDQPAFGPSAYRARSGSPGAGAVALGVLLIAAGAIALLNRYFFIDWRDLGPLLVIGLGVVVIGLAASRRT